MPSSFDYSIKLDLVASIIYFWVQVGFTIPNIYYRDYFCNCYHIYIEGKYLLLAPMVQAPSLPLI
jgi:hypothetical protein